MADMGNSMAPSAIRLAAFTKSDANRVHRCRQSCLLYHSKGMRWLRSLHRRREVGRHRRTGITEYRRDRVIDLFGLDVDRPDHLGPLLGVVGDELAEVGRRTLKYRYAQG